MTLALMLRNMIRDMSGGLTGDLGNHGISGPPLQREDRATFDLDVVPAMNQQNWKRSVSHCDR